MHQIIVMSFSVEIQDAWPMASRGVDRRHSQPYQYSPLRSSVSQYGAKRSMEFSDEYSVRREMMSSKFVCWALELTPRGLCTSFYLQH